MIRPFFQNYRASFGGLPREVWVLAVVQLINRSGTMVLPFFAIYLVTVRGFTTKQAGSMLAVYGLGSLIGSYVGGQATNRWGGIRTQVVSLILSGCGLIVLWWARTPVQIAACFFFVSVMAESMRPAAVTSITYFVPPELHPRAFVLIRLAINIGWSIGPVLGGIFAKIGYQFLFIADGITCILAGLYLVFEFGWKYELPPETDEATDTPQAATTSQSPWQDREFILAMVLQFLIAVVFFQMLGTLSLYFKEALRLDELQIGLLFGVNTLTIIAIEMPLIRSLEGVRPLQLLAWGSLLTGLGYGLLPFGESIVFVALTILVWTFGEMLSSSPSMTYTTGRATRSSRGAFVGLHTMCWAAANLAPVLGTWIYALNPDWLWHLSTLIGALTFLGFWLIDRHYHPAP